MAAMIRCADVPRISQSPIWVQDAAEWTEMSKLGHNHIALNYYVQAPVASSLLKSLKTKGKAQ